MRSLSKSKIIAYRQCARRLWLEVYRPELKEDTSATQAAYVIGNSVGIVARQIYDPDGRGETIDAQRDGYEYAFERTKVLLQYENPIFEAGFQIPGALAFADVMRRSSADEGWEMVEVKASTSVKDYHRDDIAIQAHICRSSGLVLDRAYLAHVDRSFEYQGDGDYKGLLLENDLTMEAFGRTEEVTVNRPGFRGGHLV